MRYDAIVVGSGPNGLAAAITLQRAGLSVLIIEAAGQVGGGMRTLELTLPGFHHDICSAIHPLGLGSPFFRSLPLAELGLEWIQPPVPLAHPRLGEPAILLERSLQQTVTNLGVDGQRWRAIFEPLAQRWDELAPALLGPLPISPHLAPLIRFGLPALLPATSLARLLFSADRARALFAGLAAHSFLTLESPLSASFGLVLGLLAHAMGWPLPRGGSGSIARALTRYFQSLGGEVVCGWRVESLTELPPSRIVMLDVTPRQLLEMAAGSLPPAYRRRLQRYRYGPGVFKIDYALSEPVPWRDPAVARSATVHLGASLNEIAASERAATSGSISERPYVLVAQQSLFDVTRAPDGAHTLWAYCHVPHGSTVDMRHAIENQIERYAPGFQDTILACASLDAGQMERHNPNYIGGDINGGVQDLRQLWTRPLLRFPPYSTPIPGVFLCSSSTPPGGGVHGMCGYHSARAALSTLHPMSL